jgi:predicted transcriptional regulator YdeE
MKQIELKAKTIYGLKVRTTNENEMHPETAQIGALWGAFFEKVMPYVPEATVGYGVYTNYESDAMGAFDVVAGTEVETAGLERVILQSGKYLCFEAKGTPPQAVIETWGEIWQYFTAADCPHTRTYGTDFEHYLSESEAMIYIGIV